MLLENIDINCVRIRCVSRAIQGRVCQQLHDNDNLEYGEIAKLLGVSKKTIERRRLCYHVYCKYPQWIEQDVLKPSDLEQVVRVWLKSEENQGYIEQQYGWNGNEENADDEESFCSLFGGEELVHLPMKVLMSCLQN